MTRKKKKQSHEGAHHLATESNTRLQFALPRQIVAFHLHYLYILHIIQSNTHRTLVVTIVVSDSFAVG